MEDRLFVELELPHHGWMRLALRQGSNEFSEHASCVGPDFPSQLVEALIRLLALGPPQVAWMFLEPVWLGLHFHSEGLTVCTHSDQWHQPPTIPEAGELLFQVTGSPARVARRFYLALTRLGAQAREQPHTWMQHWDTPFPEERLVQLHSSLRGPFNAPDKAES